jgi:ParB-like chromosome segregation protein Spo0J
MADRTMPGVTVRVDQVVVGERHRALDEDKVKALVESIDALGLMHPISVVQEGDFYRLVAGRHRLEAINRLGWITISAVRAPRSDKELVEIDENLIRAELSPDEWRDHLQRRKAIWEARQAEAKAATINGAPCADIPKRGRGRPKGFTAKTATITGKSKSQINRLLKPKLKKKAKAKSTAKSKAEAIETITIAVGIDAARAHYAAEFTKLPANRHDAEFDRVMGMLGHDQEATREKL